METQREQAPWDQVRADFRSAALDWVQLVGGLGDVWDQPGLGEWSVRSLVGHTSRALLTVEQYLGQEAGTVELDSPTAYYRVARPIASGAEVTARGVTAGEALGDAPGEFVADLADRVLARVARCTGDEVVPTLLGAMQLRAYLPTRTFELTVHALDLAAALDAAFEPSPGVARACLALASDLAVTDGRSGPMLLAVTGRGAAPGFSVL